jgi:hypothetical protein
MHLLICWNFRPLLVIAREGDSLLVNSDAVLAGEFPNLDRKVEEPLYHVAESPWRHRRVVRVERRGGVDYWRLKALWSRYIQVFVGPKLAIRIKRRLPLDVKPVLDVVESMDPLLASIIADETTLGKGRGPLLGSCVAPLALPPPPLAISACCLPLAGLLRPRRSS